MAGFRDFQTGEVLTAANVNDFLAKQSVMKFADAAARDTALGTATGGSNALREGMVAYLDDTDEVLAYDGSAWSSLGLPLGTATPTDGQILAFGTATSTWNPTDQIAGIGSNVANVVKVDTFTTTSSSLTPVTGLTVTITPNSASSKVLVILTSNVANSSGSANRVQLFRGATAIATATGGSSANKATWVGNLLGTNNRQSYYFSIVTLDAPATTSAVTYSVEASSSSGTLRINETADAVYGGTSSLTAIEVAA